MLPIIYLCTNYIFQIFVNVDDINRRFCRTINRLENYVREQVVQAVAVMFKRASLDSNSLNKEVLFNDVSHLIGSGDIALVLICWYM